MNYSDLFTNFWLSYGKEEGLKSKGTKSVCYESWKKAVKRYGEDEESFAKYLRSGYISYMKNRAAARSAGQFVPQLKMLSTFLNQEAWDEGFEESTGELMLNAISFNCSIEGCKTEALYITDDQRLCQAHYLKEKVYPEQGEIIKEMKEIYGSPDDQTWKEWAIGVVKKIGTFENA